ncbi:PTS sugar transporter subunit IIA [Xenophilus azovorans]|uniref:PTS sugar transporter subunit IIA n=1 Tax=Xenophilus TaxID=151754 RepID=UPI00056F14D0|nr:PTS fructose transporter subunit IIA [Xenophilus azovorans]
MNSILLVAHAPLAQALRQCALHVFPDADAWVTALDVLPNVPPEETLGAARIILAQQLGRAPRAQVLVLTDVFGATPCNVAQQLVDGVRSRLVAGVNLPMLLRAVTYRHEPLEAQVQRAIAGGTAGVMQVAVAAPPQNQARRKHSDQDIRDHQQ